MNFILFGFKRCGKTYYGKLLAQKLSVPFIDSDELIEMLYTKRYNTSLSCREIVLTRGEPFFRTLEEESLTQLFPSSASVISIGGGAILNPSIAKHLATIGLLIYLELDCQTLKDRLLSSPLPSYLDPVHPEASFEKMYQQRKPLYESIPAVRVNISQKQDEEIINQLTDLFKEHCHG